LYDARVAPPRVPPFFVQVLREHRARLANVTNRVALPELRKLYDQIGGELDRKIAALVRNRKGQTFTAYEARQLRAQVTQAQYTLAREMSGNLNNVDIEAQREAVKGVARDLTRLERKFSGSELVLPIQEVARFRGIVDKRKTSLLTMHKESIGNYGVRTVKKMEQQLAMSLSTGETTGDAVDRLMTTFHGEYWQAERIYRTETAWVFNMTQTDALDDASGEIPDLCKRWNEHVNDVTGEPMDDRVAVDSLAIHGQVARPAGLFTMPAIAPHPDAKGHVDVPDALIGHRWEAPPCRPNDRAVITPWRPHWDVPGWFYRGGRRITASRAALPR
jgi:hypothetical protein